MFFLRFDRMHESPVDPMDARDVIQHLVPFGQADKSGSMEKGRVLLVQCVNWNTAPSTLEPAPLYDARSGIRIASWARIDNRADLADKLDISSSEAHRICDTKLILKCYLKWREDSVDHLIGDFVFVLYDEKERKIFCARDHMGVRPFYYFLSDERFFCATSLSALTHIKELPIHIRTQWMVEYLLHLSMSFDRTPYEGIHKLPPAHTLTVTPTHHRLRCYFDLSSEPELKLKDSREYVDAYREQLDTAIKCRVNTSYPLGSELSGGLDSSTITAYSAGFFDQPLTNFHTFSFALGELEPRHILAVSQACGLPYNHVFTDRHLNREGLVERSLKILGYPVEHANAVSHEPFYRLAEKFHIRTLLSGFGGDEFGTTIHGYMVPMEMILKRRYKDLFNVLPGNALFRFLRMVKLGFRKIQSHDFSLPEYAPRFHEAFSKRWPHQIVRPDLVEAYDLKQRFFDRARFDAGYTDLKRFTIENRWAPFVPTRMENCGLMSAARKVEYRWPLLDVRLVKLFLSIPSEENFYRGMGRYLHRRAIDGVVPKLVTWKRSKYMGSIVRSDHSGPVDMDTLSITDLHPKLAELIDVNKLGEQIATMAPSKAGIDDGLAFQCRRNGLAVKNLNQWLQQDFS